MYRIAQELNKFPWEVEQTLTEIDMLEWFTFFELQAEEHKKAEKRRAKKPNRL